LLLHDFICKKTGKMASFICGDIGFRDVFLTVIF